MIMHEGQQSTQMTLREEVVLQDQSTGRQGHKHREQGQSAARRSTAYCSCLTWSNRPLEKKGILFTSEEIHAQFLFFSCKIQSLQQGRNQLSFIQHFMIQLHPPVQSRMEATTLTSVALKC